MTGEDTAFAEAQATIVRLAAHIEDLERQLAAAASAHEVRTALKAASSAGAVASPTEWDELLRLIVGVAAQILSAEAGSLLLVDKDGEHLTFEVAVGGKAEEVGKFRVPIGHSIGGFVAITGQPLAVSDAANDPRLAMDIAQRVGYVPRNVLCIPVVHRGRVIAVLELLNKEGGDSFTPGDMDTLALFGTLAGVAIGQLRPGGGLAGMARRIVDGLDAVPEEERDRLADHAHTLLAAEGGEGAHASTLELAALLHTITGHGDEAARAAAAMLRGFAGYLQASTGTIDYTAKP